MIFIFTVCQLKVLLNFKSLETASYGNEQRKNYDMNKNCNLGNILR